MCMCWQAWMRKPTRLRLISRWATILSSGPTITIRLETSTSSWDIVRNTSIIRRSRRFLGTRFSGPPANRGGKKMTPPEVCTKKRRPIRPTGGIAGFCALCVTALLVFLWAGTAGAKEPAFKVLAFYSTDVEPDHVHTAKDALVFFREVAAKNNFTFDETTDWSKLNDNDLKPYQLILWLNNFPQTPEQRVAFERYMEHGGGWLGFHVAGYNDETPKWPGFVVF